jgi:putative flippase GtrA
VGLDAAVYASATSLLGASTFVSKGISFVVGAVFAYVANWRFTFGERRGKHSEVTFIVVYLVALGLNVATNHVALTLIGYAPLTLTFAFLAATGVSAVWNFVCMATFVFRRPRRPWMEGQEN